MPPLPGGVFSVRVVVMVICVCLCSFCGVSKGVCDGMGEVRVWTFGLYRTRKGDACLECQPHSLRTSKESMRNRNDLFITSIIYPFQTALVL